MTKKKWEVHMGNMRVTSVLCIMFYIMQWNARSLIANGQELKHMLDGLEHKPEIICIEETWLKPRLDFKIPGYKCERKDRENIVGGGCATFIRNGIQYRRIEMNTVLECVITEVWTDRGKITCINLEDSYFQEIVDKISVPVVWVGDFNAHNELWGSKKKNRNGKIVEDFIDKNQLVVLNDGRPTWFRTSRAVPSSIDITIASAELASVSRWETMDRYTMGSDHLPIICKFGRCLIVEPVNLDLRLNYKRAIKFEDDVNMGLSMIDSEKGVDQWNSSLSKVLRTAAAQNIPKKKIPVKGSMVPWWSEECNSVVRARNRAYKRLRKHLIESYAIEYKRLRAKARRVIKEAKKQSWRNFCGKLGPDTPINKIWSFVHRMTGAFQQATIPVLHFDGAEAVNNKEKVNMLVKQFQKVHSSNNVSDGNRRRRCEVLREQLDKLQINSDNSDNINLFFSLEEIQKVTNQGKDTSPGRDGLGYHLFKHSGELMREEVLALINKVWESGCLPKVRKHAVIIPIVKPVKQSDNPGSSRPIALTSVLCKIMERMITDRLVDKLEKSEKNHSGFGKGRSTMDAVSSVDMDINKAIANKEAVVAVFLDIEKAYDMLWWEGLLIPLYDVGIRGRMFN